MKKILLFILIPLFGVKAYADQTVITEKFPAAGIREVEAITTGGSISVSGYADSEAIVEIFASHHKNWSQEKIKQVLKEAYSIQIENKNGKLYVKVERKTSFRQENSLNISIHITAPREINTQLKTSGGSIRLDHLSGNLQFATSGGSLQVNNTSGNINGKTSGGSIRVSNSREEIRLTTSGGSIRAENCQGNLLLKTSGGSITLSALEGNIQAATSGGSIRATAIAGTLKATTSGGSINMDEISGNLETSTSGGSMTIRLSDVDQYVTISGSSNITLTLPKKEGYNLSLKASHINMGQISGFQGEYNSNKIIGTIGKGGPAIQVSTAQRLRLSFD